MLFVVCCTKAKQLRYTHYSLPSTRYKFKTHDNSYAKEQVSQASYLCRVIKYAAYAVVVQTLQDRLHLLLRLSCSRAPPNEWPHSTNVLNRQRRMQHWSFAWQVCSATGQYSRKGRLALPCKARVSMGSQLARCYRAHRTAAEVRKECTFYNAVDERLGQQAPGPAQNCVGISYNGFYLRARQTAVS